MSKVDALLLALNPLVRIHDNSACFMATDATNPSAPHPQFPNDRIMMESAEGYAITYGDIRRIVALAKTVRGEQPQ